MCLAFYGIYAYLKPHDYLSAFHRCAVGNSALPPVNEELNATVAIQGHAVHFKTINLALPWQQVEKGLWSLVPLPAN